MNDNTGFNLFHGDCLEKLKHVQSGSVDMILADLPYGTTACKWDNVIPFEPLWAELHRVCKPNAAMCMFGSEPFSSHLRMSNLKRFKYDWIWNKKKVSGWLNAKKRPLVQHEVISVFYREAPPYFPQLHSNKLRRDFRGVLKPFDITDTVGKQRRYVSEVGPDKSYPRSIIAQTAVIGNSQEKVAHGTQKPVSLLEYFIKTYTNEGDTVLDPTMGSGSTGVACKSLNRRFIGIEMDDKYFEMAKSRINLGVSPQTKEVKTVKPNPHIAAHVNGLKSSIHAVEVQITILKQLLGQGKKTKGRDETEEEDETDVHMDDNDDSEEADDTADRDEETNDDSEDIESNDSESDADETEEDEAEEKHVAKKASGKITSEQLNDACKVRLQKLIKVNKMTSKKAFASVKALLQKHFETDSVAQIAKEDRAKALKVLTAPVK